MMIDTGRRKVVGLCGRQQGEPLHQRVVFISRRGVEKVLGVDEMQMKLCKKKVFAMAQQCLHRRLSMTLKRHVQITCWHKLVICTDRGRVLFIFYTMKTSCLVPALRQQEKDPSARVTVRTGM